MTSRRPPPTALISTAAVCATAPRPAPLRAAGRVENDPLDYVVNASTGADQITPEQLAWEISEVHQLDPGRTVETPPFDGWNSTVDMVQRYAPALASALRFYPSGHPGETLAAGDA